MRLLVDRWMLCLLVATALPGHIARGEAPDPVASDLAEVRRSGHLTMLCWPHQESRFVRRMVAEYGEEGLHRFAGIDVEILRGFAESLGVRLEVKPMPQSFSELLPSLLRGDGQVIASSWTITEARASQVDFSRPYHSVEKLVLARRTSQLASVADFVGLTAAVVAGSSHEEHLLALGTESLRIEQTEFTFQNYAEVAEGRADFTVVDSGAVQKVLEENVEFANLTTAFVFPREDEYGFAVAPGSDLLAPLNAYLQEIEKSGELERIKARHLQAAD